MFATKIIEFIFLIGTFNAFFLTALGIIRHPRDQMQIAASSLHALQRVSQKSASMALRSSVVSNYRQHANETEETEIECIATSRHRASLKRTRSQMRSRFTKLAIISQWISVQDWITRMLKKDVPDLYVQYVRKVLFLYFYLEEIFSQNVSRRIHIERKSFPTYFTLDLLLTRI